MGGGSLLLFLFDVSQDCPEAFVLGVCCMSDALLVRIEDGKGQGDAFGAHLSTTICELIGIDVFADKTTCQVVHLTLSAF